MRKIANYIIIALFIISCDPTSSVTVVDNKIKSLTVLFNNDTAFYKFTYNNVGYLDTVFNGTTPYALFQYSTDKVIITRITPTYFDSILVYKSSANYIDSIVDGSGVKRFYRNISEQLDSIRYRTSNFTLYNNTIQLNNNDILLYNQTLPYTCNFFNFCTEASNDTISYLATNNQANLPEQFIGIPISEGLNFLDLNPIIMLQQSGIFPYQPHNHLRKNWITKYSIFISQSPPSAYRFNYQYRFDAQNRVTAIYVYNNVSSSVIPFKEYHITY